MNSGESFRSPTPSNDERISEWFDDEPNNDSRPDENLPAEEIVEQLIAERHRPADPKIVYPEIFDDRYSGDISPQCRSVLESFDKADFFDLLDAYRVDLRFGNRRLIGFLTKMLGLKERPTIIYKEKTGDLEGEFLIGKDKKPYIFFYYQPENHKPNYEECVTVIAHEMWHAYQEERRHDGDARGDLYDANYRHYIDSDDDEKGYFSQLIEKEANWLGYGLRNKMREATSKEEDFVTKVKRRLNSFEKRHGIQS